MKIELNLAVKELGSANLNIIAAFTKLDKKAKKETNTLVSSHLPKSVKESLTKIDEASEFLGKSGQTLKLYTEAGESVLLVGLGEKSKITVESLRRDTAKVYKAIKDKYKTVAISLDSFIAKSNLENSAHAITESLLMTEYVFDEYLTKKSDAKLESVTLYSAKPKSGAKKISAAITAATNSAESINLARNFVNEPPNVLHSEEFAKRVVADAKKLKGVKVKVLGKKEITKEKMGMFLSVNAGSAYEPQLVHLSYTPSKATKRTKHIGLVGKGLTFDTGGYSLKPSASMVNMKFDMAGAATMYGAFRAAVLNGCPVKLSCFLGMTDNAVNSKATMPDAIVTARNGKTVEILNTDAEGRLVLGDVMDYACDQGLDMMIDAATLTGACLVSLGSEVCGLMGNDQKLCDSLLKSAKNADEYMWQLPIIDEFRNDMKGSISDVKNMGGSRWGGTSKAAAFLENFVQDGVKWAHLDIAGVGDSQSHLPYCPAKGASGIIIRSVADFIKNSK